MKILHVAGEIAPYAATGGMAQMVASLASAQRARGHEVACAMPLYRGVWEGHFPLVDTGVRTRAAADYRPRTAEIWKTGDDVAVYLVRRDEFFDRRELYSLPERDYDDNFTRFSFFQKCVTELINQGVVEADIVHCHDWQASLMPLYLRHSVARGGETARRKSVITVHNLVYQGIFPAEEFSGTNLPFSCFSSDVLEFYGNINCLKGGLVAADAITTVSDTYAREIQTTAYGVGLDGVLRDGRDRLRGIVNGIDYELWNPETDSYLAENYNAERLDGKTTCRQTLADRLGLDPGGGPIIGMIARLAEIKGFELLNDSIEELMRRPLSLVVLGKGESKYHAMCRRWARQWPGRVAVALEYNDELAHQIAAGADMLLVPSRIEACGFSQLHSQRYGTPPIAHATGGLIDTIEPVGPDRGTGFLFDTFRPAALVGSVDAALAAFEDRSGWQAIMRRGMALDTSWEKSAREYEAVYETCLARTP